jgi:hypothetical protein
MDTQLEWIAPTVHIIMLDEVEGSLGIGNDGIGGGNES